MVKEPGPVLGVGGGAEDVHHHEVLDVELLAPRLLQLVDVVPQQILHIHTALHNYLPLFGLHVL